MIFRAWRWVFRASSRSCSSRKLFPCGHRSSPTRAELVKAYHLRKIPAGCPPRSFWINYGQKRNSQVKFLSNASENIYVRDFRASRISTNREIASVASMPKTHIQFYQPPSLAPRWNARKANSLLSLLKLLSIRAIVHFSNHQVCRYGISNHRNPKRQRKEFKSIKS